MNTLACARWGSLVILAAACASQSSTSNRETRPARARADLITREQIAAGKFLDAYEAVEALHNNWLIVRNVTPSLGGGSAPAPRPDTSRVSVPGAGASGGAPREGDRVRPGMNAGIQVYIDGVRVGGVQELKRIAVSSVFSIRRYGATEAQTRFGVGHTNGVIAVSTTPDKP